MWAGKGSTPARRARPRTPRGRCPGPTPPATGRYLVRQLETLGHNVTLTPACTVRKPGYGALTCEFVRREIDDSWHAARYDPVVRLPDSSPDAADDHPDGPRRAGQCGRGSGAAAPGRGAAPAGAAAGPGTGGPGRAGRPVAAATSGAGGGVLRHPGHAVSLAPQPGRSGVDLPDAAAWAATGHGGVAGIGASAGSGQSDLGG